MAFVQRWTLNARKSGAMAAQLLTNSAMSSSTPKDPSTDIAEWIKRTITSNAIQSNLQRREPKAFDLMNTKSFQKRAVWIFAMQRRRSAAHHRGHGSIILENDNLHSRNWIRMQVSNSLLLTARANRFLTQFSISLPFVRATSGTIEASNEFPEHGLVRDGTPCGENLVCVNQTCVSLFPYIDTSKCPTNQHNVECSGNGVSSALNATGM